MGSFPQVSLLELFEGAVLSSVPARNHGEVGGELQHVVREALLLDSRTSFRAQLAKSEVVKLKILPTHLPKKYKPEGVASLVAPCGGPGDLLNTSNLPLGGDHLGELHKPGVAALGDHPTTAT